ncbi:SPFH domain-containing protein [Mycolicibacterium conceptionense]|uniref:SPFH domain-containing protein n=1 Tax=Mycolicibacterium conceptionense TaxID=451644 RepID=UPI000AA20432|nr:SPFH domain-containing protein [Mycolicibacterium conceptionense]
MFWTITAAIFIVAGIATFIVGGKIRQSADSRLSALKERLSELKNGDGASSYHSTYERDRAREQLADASDDARIKDRVGFFTVIGGIAVFGLGILIVLFCSVTQVSTKSIGVVTTFGKPSRYLSNGLHLIAPWQDVTELDGAIQTDPHVDEGDKKGAISARLGNNSTARVDTTVVWRIKPEAAPGLYQDYRDQEKIRENLVTRELTAALNDTLASYNPLTLTDEGDGAVNGKNAQIVLEKLRAKVGDRIEVIGVNIPVIHFDERTQQSINALQTEIANTKIATQRQKTADAEAQANDKLRASVTDPNVLVSKCLDLVREKGGSPAGCWPGSAGAVVAIPGK